MVDISVGSNLVWFGGSFGFLGSVGSRFVFGAKIEAREVQGSVLRFGKLF